MSRLNNILLAIGLCFTTGLVYAQSDNCATATPLTLTGGTICVNGTTTNATSNNTMYGGCNAAPVNEVWYTYVATGTQNDFTIISNGLSEIEIMIDVDGCANNTFEICNTATGTNTLNQNWGVPIGTQVWVMIASNAGTEGGFQLCIDSYDPSPGNGNACTGAIPVCDASLTYNTPDIGIYGFTGTVPSCFGSPPSQDIYYQFTVSQTGILEWEATPIGASIELDWSIWDITGGCPGTEIVCNYNYASNTSQPAGMIAGVSCTTCPTSALGGACGEYCDPITVTAGNTYVIQIDNYTGTPNTGLDFAFGPGMTALIAPVADFTINPSGITCGTNITINIADVSVGIPDWTFGNGNTFTGNSPPAQTYTNPGVYALTATINGSCPATHTEYVEIYGPVTAITSFTDENCSACDGTAGVVAAGGDGIFSYLWSNAGETTPNITGLCAGSYTVTVSNATCGTQVIETVVVGQGGLFPWTTSSTMAACAGDSNGTATLTALSGNPPYTYLWSDGQNTSTATGLSSGVYTISVTDAFGCDTITSVTVADPAAVLIDASAVVITNASCIAADGSLMGITASGGTGTLTYSWVDGTPTVVGTSLNLTSVGAGSYTLTVTDSNGCLDSSGPFFVVATTANTVTMAGGSTNCYLSCDAFATATAAGGTPPYFYAWSTSPLQTSTLATGLCVGKYYVTVSDASCSPSGTELVTNGDFSAGTAGITSAYYNCNASGCLGAAGGFAVGANPTFYNGGFTGSDHTTGTGDFMVINGSAVAGTNIWCQTITVTPGTNYQFSTWLSTLNVASPAILQFTANGTPLGAPFNAPAGLNTWIQFFETWNSGASTSVQICVTNQNTAGGGNDFGLDDISFQECINGCPTIDSIIIAEPTELLVLMSDVDALCFTSCDGSATASASGGTVPYTYLWDNSGTSSTETGLCSGTYLVTITDLNGCDTVMGIFVDRPSAFVIGGNMTPEKCDKADGTASATVSGGTPPYSYLWDDPGATANDTVTGLSSSSSYNVTVTDGNGCMDSSLTLSPPFVVGPEIDTIQSTGLLCFGDANATATVINFGGTTPFSFQWDDPSSQNTAQATGLAAGTYFVTLSDLYGCDTVGTIIIDPIPQLLISVTGTDTLCFGMTNGELNTETVGGQGPYTYNWDNGLPALDTINFSPTVTATYTVTVTDSTACTATTFMEIYIGTPLVASPGNKGICEGDPPTSISAFATGGDPPYNYLWDDGSTSVSISVSPITTTSYTVTINDGCSTPTVETITVTVGPKPIADFSATCDPDPYFLQFTDKSFIPPPAVIPPAVINSWFWDFDDGMTSTKQNPENDYATPMIYSVSLTVTTSDNCKDTYVGPVQSSPIAGFSADPPETTTANPNIEFTDQSTGPIVSWTWEFGDGETDQTSTPTFWIGGALNHIYDSAGTYKILLTVSDAQDCIDTSSEFIQILEEYILFAPNVFTPNGNALNEYFMPIGVGIDPDHFELLIFDRWGDLVFETKEYELGWDGRANDGQRAAQTDVYIWVVNTIDPHLKKHQYIGHVTLIK